ncbi:TonB-dependent receptor [Swaminathania salitolerans]|uniref:TonB-dependent receptor n=1 Tax=Swaminathania salitolerans TaxID=182838 RepID=A0A511BS30_9PROT|nr:TonB-dependent receptor [Swaminathania salitolerans]GBQ12722.1 TonB-dependent receptor [Swaminathania salitolerans LMG 21291]GEL03146.1 TonB-dependent receptor [Swaminathania salitolerans]
MARGKGLCTILTVLCCTGGAMASPGGDKAAGHDAGSGSAPRSNAKSDAAVSALPPSPTRMLTRAPMHQGGLESIVVTAQKRSENLQKTPISMSVMTAKQLANRHVVSLVDLGDGSIPSLRIAQFAGRNSALVVNIRGVGVLGDSNQPARDQGVGVYIDGVYVARPQALGTALFDVQSIEVLKGPQGTLFGRNTEGGALNIVTRRPTGRFGMRLLGGFGNFASNKGELHLDLPAFHDVAIKIDAVTAHRDPLVRNLLDDTGGFNQYDKHGVHVEALWTPVRNFTADYAYDNSYDSTTTLWMQLLEGGRNPRAEVATLQRSRARSANIGVPERPSIGRTSGHRMTLAYRAIPKYLTLKSITAYRELSQSQYDNGMASGSMSNISGDFTGWKFARNSLAGFWQDQVSQEVQAIGHTRRLKYVGGFMYYRENASDNAQAFYTNRFLDPQGSRYTLIGGPAYDDWSLQPIDRASRVATTSWGVYGHAVYTPPVLHDAVHLTAGLRWSRDAKRGVLSVVNNKPPVNTNGDSGPIGFDAAWSRVDPMLNISGDLSRNIMLYGKWSTGYKAGGANSRAQDYEAFGPESVSMFEVGTKTEFLDHRARFNLAGYWGSYKDIQVDFSKPYQIGNQITTRTTTSTINAPGKGDLSGVEADMQIMPLRDVTIGFSYAYNHVRIPPTANPYPNSAGIVSALLVPIYQSYTPAHSGSFQIDYTRPFEGFTLLAHLDGNIDSGYYASATDPVYLGVGNPRNVYQPRGDSGLIVNGRIAMAGLRLGRTGAKATLSLWSRNLFAEQHVYFKYFGVSNGLQGYFNEARQFGGQVELKF